MTERVTIQQQIDEVRCCRLSMESAVAAWRLAPAKHRGVETGCCQSKIEPLRQAERTLEWVRDNAEALRAGALSGAAP